MAKVQNAYECDACHQLFQAGERYDSNGAKGADLQLGKGAYGLVGSPRWDFDHVCDSCRRQLSDAITSIVGRPTDEPEPAPDVPPLPAKEVA
jgi:hypothetical protein